MQTALIVFAATAIGGVVAYGIIWGLKAWFTWPQLRIRCLRGSSSSESGMPDHLRLTWDERLELYNSTNWPALDVSFQWPHVGARLPLERLEPPHVTGTERKEIPFKIRKDFPAEQVLSCHNRFEDLLPPELYSFVLVVRYKNEKGVPFYTRFEKSGDTESCTYHRRRPKE